MKRVRPLRIDGDIAHITLSQGYVAIIDAADAPLVDGVNWAAWVARKRDGSIRSVYAIRTCAHSNPTSIYLHRVIMGEPSHLDVDHIDGDGLNNRRANLRLATTAQNQHNSRLAIDNTSGFKGVYWSADKRKWRARISDKGHRHHLGFFGCPTAAAISYVKASAALHGQFGRIK